MPKIKLDPDNPIQSRKRYRSKRQRKKPKPFVYRGRQRTIKRKPIRPDLEVMFQIEKLKGCETAPDPEANREARAKFLVSAWENGRLPAPLMKILDRVFKTAEITSS